MRFSIITATKNNKAGLLRAIECVRNQTYKNVEHIVVDGGSTDGTKEILRQAQNDILRQAQDDNREMESGMTARNYQLLAISEPDEGIYDAINKGIKLATGDVIGLLHSDDLYADENVLEKYVEVFNSDSGQPACRTGRAGMTGGIEAVYSDLVYVSKNQEARSLELGADSGQAGMTRRVEAVYSDLVYVSKKRDVRSEKLEAGNLGTTNHQPACRTGRAGMTGGIEAVYSDLVYVRRRQEVRSEKLEAKNSEPTNLPTGQAGYSLLTTNYSVIRYWRSHGKSVDSGSRSEMTTSDHYSLITDDLLRNGWMPPHPTLFIRKEIFDKYGPYRTDMRIAADYEMILRLLYKHKITSYYLPVTTYLMSIGGASNRSLKNILQKSKEDYQAMKMNGINFPLFTLASKNLRKLPQFLARELS